MERGREGGRGYPAYRTLWIWLLLGWVVAYADRTITGPVVTYMIDALTADIVATPAYMGAAFGMWNLIAEIGAVLSPAISGVLRGATGSWATAVMVDGVIVLVGFLLILFVRESRTISTDESQPSKEATE